MRIAINGFGRIGKTFLRCLLTGGVKYENIRVVAINIGSGDVSGTAYALMYDTLMGTYSGDAFMDGSYLIVDMHRIYVIAENDPEQLPWRQCEIDWVVECSGKFTRRNDAQKHCKSGARAVLISAPAYREDIAIVPGVNEQLFDKKKHMIVSLGSCTTNALLVLLKVLHDSCGIQSGWMTTTHAYTNSQVLLDIPARDARTSRAAALNIIPTSTGASQMIEKIIPELSGKIHAMAIRVPVGKVSLIELIFEMSTQFSLEQLYKTCQDASENSLKGYLGLTRKPLVSSDFSGNDNSIIIDGLLMNMHGKNAQIFGWYDNEWGYSMRLCDFLLYVSRL